MKKILTSFFVLSLILLSFPVEIFALEERSYSQSSYYSQSGYSAADQSKQDNPDGSGFWGQSYYEANYYSQGPYYGDQYDSYGESGYGSQSGSDSGSSGSGGSGSGGSSGGDSSSTFNYYLQQFYRTYAQSSYDPSVLRSLIKKRNTGQKIVDGLREMFGGLGISAESDETYYDHGLSQALVRDEQAKRLQGQGIDAVVQGGQVLIRETSLPELTSEQQEFINIAREAGADVDDPEVVATILTLQEIATDSYKGQGPTPSEYFEQQLTQIRDCGQTGNCFLYPGDATINQDLVNDVIKNIATAGANANINEVDSVVGSFSVGLLNVHPDVFSNRDLVLQEVRDKKESYLSDTNTATTNFNSLSRSEQARLMGITTQEAQRIANLTTNNYLEETVGSARESERGLQLRFSEYVKDFEPIVAEVSRQLVEEAADSATKAEQYALLAKYYEYIDNTELADAYIDIANFHAEEVANDAFVMQMLGGSEGDAFDSLVDYAPKLNEDFEVLESTTLILAQEGLNEEDATLGHMALLGLPTNLLRNATAEDIEALAQAYAGELSAATRNRLLAGTATLEDLQRVAQITATIINRAGSRGTSLEGQVHACDNRGICQYSFWNPDKRGQFLPVFETNREELENLALAMLSGEIATQVGGVRTLLSDSQGTDYADANHYLNPYATIYTRDTRDLPRWARDSSNYIGYVPGDIPNPNYDPSITNPQNPNFWPTKDGHLFLKSGYELGTLNIENYVPQRALDAANSLGAGGGLTFLEDAFAFVSGGLSLNIGEISLGLSLEDGNFGIVTNIPGIGGKSPTYQYSDQEAREYLASHGIDVNKVCGGGITGTCLGGIQHRTLETLVEVSELCGCQPPTVTGGTETGFHSNSETGHHYGYKVDIRITDEAGQQWLRYVQSLPKQGSFHVDPSKPNVRYLIEDLGDSNAHIDMQVLPVDGENTPTRRVTQQTQADREREQTRETISSVCKAFIGGTFGDSICNGAATLLTSEGGPFGIVGNTGRSFGGSVSGGSGSSSRDSYSQASYNTYSQSSYAPSTNKSCAAQYNRENGYGDNFNWPRVCGQSRHDMVCGADPSYVKTANNTCEKEYLESLGWSESTGSSFSPSSGTQSVASDLKVSALKAESTATDEYRFSGSITRTLQNSSDNLSASELQAKMDTTITNELQIRFDDPECKGSVDATKTFTTPYRSLLPRSEGSEVLISEYLPVSAKGDHCFSFIVDINNDITETDESNNQSTWQNFSTAFDVDTQSEDQSGASSALGFQVQTYASDGSVAKSWRSGSITVGSGENLAFKWNAPSYETCVPFIYPINYSFEGDLFPTTQNTNAANINVRELDATYALECKVGDNKTREEIKVTVE